MTVELQGLRLDGVSIGGFVSTLDIPEFKTVIDLGVCLDQAIARDLVLITHAHADHLGAIAQHVAQRGLRGLPPATYLVPPGIEGEVEALLATWRELDGGELPASIVPFEPGRDWRLRKDLVVRAFRTRHRVVSQGYLFERVRSHLLPEYRGLTGPEIASLRRSGTQVTAETREIALAVTGDTTLDAVLAAPEVLSAERLVVEATFLGDDVSPERSRRLGHVHLDEIAEAADRFTCRALLLNHVSPRYSRGQAEELVRRKLPPDLAGRTQLMLPGHS